MKVREDTEAHRSCQILPIWAEAELGRLKASWS
jgi:hypothetical protein